MIEGNNKARFAITKAGRVTHPNWALVSYGQKGAQCLYDVVAAEFGRADHFLSDNIAALLRLVRSVATPQPGTVVSHVL